MDVSTKEKYLNIIKEKYPRVNENHIQTLFNGNDHYVFVVNNKIAFRFPKEPQEINSKRAIFLEKFASLSPIELPQIETHKDQETGINYEINNFLPGVSFYPEIATTFSHDERMAVARKLGNFLSAVHSFSKEEARKLEIDEMNPKDFWEYMEQNPNAFPKYKKLVYPYISTEEKSWIEKLFTNYISLIKHEPFKTKVIHSDMWVFHIIVDPEKHTLSGVIDFGPRIADAANDFKAFEYYGNDFVQEVYRNYSLPRDKQFDKRRLFYTGHDEVFEFARSIERRDEEKIKNHKESLSNYIKKHSFA